MKGKDGGKVVEEFEKEGKVVTKEEMERGRGKGKGKYIGKENRVRDAVTLGNEG